MIEKKAERITLIIFIILCSIVLIGCNAIKKKNEDLGGVDNKVLMIIDGVITDATMNTITIKNSSGNIYSFEKNKQVLEVNEDGITIGMTATIQYYGELINSNMVQKVEVIKIIIKPKNDLVIANEILNNMTIEEKVGQMFYVRCPEENAIEELQKYNIGGYILFQRDFEGKTKDEIITTIEGYQTTSKVRMLIGVDEEGGTVNRVSSLKEFRDSPFLSPKELFKQGGWQLIESDTDDKSKLLKELGININMAPVCDVVTNTDSFMYDRSFSKDGDLTTEYVKKVVRIMNENKMGSVLKHFPGYGDNVDTHTGIAIDNREYSNFENIDFKPFKSGIEEGADAVLVSHNIIQSMDSNYPASLSKEVHKILREEIGFNGIIMTDDLFMDAIRKYTNNEEAAVMAVKAGNDLICTTDFEVQIPAVIEAVKVGEVSEEQIDESVLRILMCKIKLGIINK